MQGRVCAAVRRELVLPNLLDVELVVGQIVIDVAVDGARECVAGVGVMFSDGSDSLHGESAVTFAEFHPRRFVDAEMYLVVVYAISNYVAAKRIALIQQFSKWI